MNEDHSLSIYAMAKRTSTTWPSRSSGRPWKITNAILKSVTLQGCLIQVVLCCDDLCQVQKITFPFEPPLTDAAQLRPRMVAIHQEVCKPQVSEIFRSNPLVAPAVTIFFAGLAYGTLFLDADQLTHMIETSFVIEFLRQHLECCSAQFFSTLVRLGFYATLCAHLVESTYIAYHSRTTLKFSVGTTAAWVLPNLVIGFPVLFAFQDMLRVDRKGKMAKK